MVKEFMEHKGSLPGSKNISIRHLKPVQSSYVVPNPIYFSEICFNIIFSSTPTSPSSFLPPYFSSNIFYIFLISSKRVTCFTQLMFLNLGTLEVFEEWWS